MQYLLDTSICVFFLRGKLNLDDLIKEKGRENCYISEITAFELRYGAEQIHFNKDKNTYEIVKLYDGPDVTLSQKVGVYAPNAFGVYDMCGNVAEMIVDEGKAVGGSFDSSGYDVRVESMEEYQDVSPLVGFRPILIIKE